MTNNIDQKRLLEIVNTIKDINRIQMRSVTSAIVQDLDYSDRILADALGFDNLCEQGRVQVWSDYQVAQKELTKSKNSTTPISINYRQIVQSLDRKETRYAIRYYPIYNDC